MIESKPSHILKKDITEDFLRTKFQIKYKFIEIFFYSNEFVYVLPLFPKQLARMLNILLQAAKILEAPICGIDLHIVNDGQMSIFNSHYMQRPGPTNILSFPAGRDMTGSLVLSLPCLLRESRLYGQDLKEYFFYLLCHGLAHLAGFEHGKEMEKFIETLKKEYSIIDKLPD